MAHPRFSEFDDERLINLVGKNPPLYDTSAHDYKDCTAKEIKWVQIGAALNKTAKQCKVRWKHIRDYYRKQKKFTRGPQTRKKMYTESLHFLDVVESEKNGDKYELCIKTETDSLEDDEGPSFPCTIDDEVSEEPKICNCEVVTNNTQVSESVCNAHQEEFAQREHEKNFFEAEGDIDLFFKAMAATVKKFSPYTQAGIKLKVFQMVHEEEMRHISQNTALLQK